jgi:hypothetical protein
MAGMAILFSEGVQLDIVGSDANFYRAGDNNILPKLLFSKLSICIWLHCIIKMWDDLLFSVGSEAIHQNQI